MKRTTYELNFYPTEKGDGIYKMCNTKKQALKEYEILQNKYPNREGDAFIKVWYDYDGDDADVVNSFGL